MFSSGWIVVVLLVAIAALMAWRMRGKSLERMFEDAEREHHHVHDVIARHPHGGTWWEFSRWLKENGRR